jgi:hypothetical protein
MRVNETSAANKSGGTADWVQMVEDAVEDLHFGVVQIVVHNAKVVQIEGGKSNALLAQGENVFLTRAQLSF